jgi:hypothetical protein
MDIITLYQLHLQHQDPVQNDSHCLITYPVLPPRTTYEDCLESVRPFWISREPVTWPWCILAAIQRRPYCESVNSHSPVGLVGRQWDAIDRACILCYHHINDDRESRSASQQCAFPFYSSHAVFFWQSIASPRSASPPTAQIWLSATSGFSQS